MYRFMVQSIKKKKLHTFFQFSQLLSAITPRHLQHTPTHNAAQSVVCVMWVI